MKEWIQNRMEEYDPNLIMPRSVMWAAINRIESVIEKTVDELHIPPSHGTTRQKRAIRLNLASHVFGRKVTSFKDLQDWELWALDRWVTETQANGIRDWMKETYGEQVALC